MAVDAIRRLVSKGDSIEKLGLRFDQTGTEATLFVESVDT